MSFSGDFCHTSVATASSSGGGSDPLQNLSAIQTRVHSLQKFLQNSVNNNILIGKDQRNMVSAELTTAIHQLIANGTALIASTETQNTQNTLESFPSKNQIIIDEKELQNSEDYKIIEVEAMELLAEHIHFCEICGKGFKRDANLRMHMRAHGDQFKTIEALAKPADASKSVDFSEKEKRTRYSCPFIRCNRNKQHKKFRPLKSVVCVRNHFKRTHCPKMYSCTRCQKKSFSVVADLKSHMKHCGESKWTCSCGTSFSRKDKLIGHMELFEGHMPAVTEVEGGNVVAENGGASDLKSGMFEDLDMEGYFGCYDNYSFLDSPNTSGIDDFFKLY